MSLERQSPGAMFAQSAASLVVYPAGDSVRDLLAGVWHHRWPIWTIFKQNLAAPFRGSVFGRFWNIMLPLVPVGAYLFLRLVFASGGAEEGIHPAAYVVVGVTFWYIFSDVMIATMTGLRRNRVVVSGTSFPILGAVVVGYGQILYEAAVRLLLIAPVVVVLHGVPGWGALWALPLALLALSFFSGVGLMLLCATFVFPDIEQIVTVVMRYLIFVSLVIFPLPDGGTEEWFRLANPFAFFVDAIRNALVGVNGWSAVEMGVYAVVSVAVLGAGLKLVAVLRQPIRSLIE